jgi:hypothetical protein
MDDRMCTLFEVCQTPEAPLCPLQLSTIRHGIWYGDEAICRAGQFQNISWIQKQHRIAALRLKTDDGFFTVKMLTTLKVIGPGLKGANPDDVNPESKWFKARKRKVGNHISGNRRRISEKEQTSVLKLF